MKLPRVDDPSRRGGYFPALERLRGLGLNAKGERIRTRPEGIIPEIHLPGTVWNGGGPLWTLGRLSSAFDRLPPKEKGAVAVAAWAGHLDALRPLAVVMAGDLLGAAMAVAPKPRLVGPGSEGQPSMDAVLNPEDRQYLAMKEELDKKIQKYRQLEETLKKLKRDIHGLQGDVETFIIALRNYAGAAGLGIDFSNDLAQILPPHEITRMKGDLQDSRLARQALGQLREEGQKLIDNYTLTMSTSLTASSLFAWAGQIVAQIKVKESKIRDKWEDYKTQLGALAAEIDREKAAMGIRLLEEYQGRIEKKLRDLANGHADRSADYLRAIRELRDLLTPLSARFEVELAGFDQQLDRARHQAGEIRARMERLRDQIQEVLSRERPDPPDPSFLDALARCIEPFRKNGTFRDIDLVARGVESKLILRWMCLTVEIRDAEDDGQRAALRAERGIVEEKVVLLNEIQRQIGEAELGLVQAEAEIGWRESEAATRFEAHQAAEELPRHVKRTHSSLIQQEFDIHNLQKRVNGETDEIRLVQLGVTLQTKIVTYDGTMTRFRDQVAKVGMVFGDANLGDPATRARFVQEVERGVEKIGMAYLEAEEALNDVRGRRDGWRDRRATAEREYQTALQEIPEP